MISLILAADENGTIGRDNGLPWNLPTDLNYFHNKTRGKTVIMGSKTFESIGRPLPKRRNIIVSRNPAFAAPGCEIVTSPKAALELSKNDGEVMVMGGAQIYHAFLPHADRIYLTRVHTQVDGDTTFTFDESQWHEVSREDHVADEENEYPFSFITLERQDS